MTKQCRQTTGRHPWSCGAGLLWIVFLATACEAPAAPVACGALPQLTVNVGETADVTACFGDENGDVLSYTASSSNPRVATATIAGTRVTVTAVSPGNTSVTVTASDPGQLEGHQSFSVVVPNRAPEPRGTLPGVTLPVGQATTIEASRYFSDPDGETLSYSAGSSDPAVAGSSVAGSTVTVTAQGKGSTTVTITASDPGGLSATQSFVFTVPNREPVPVGTIDPQEIEAGQSVTIDVATSFDDPDDDPLTYTAASSMPTVAGTSVSGSAVTINAVAPGVTTVTITAADDEQATATQRLTVTVSEPNRPPRRVGSIPARSITVGASAMIVASSYFSDPDGDALTYTAASSAPTVASESVSGSIVTITAVTAGTATITVTAQDPAGLTATQLAHVTVTLRNRAPMPVGTIPAQSLNQGSSATVDASLYFSDPDGDALTYTAVSFNPAVATESVSGSTVTITGMTAGTATITVTARDPGGLSATQTIGVTVIRPSGPDLVVTLSRSSVTVTPGSSFSYDKTVRNQGVAASAATRIRTYASSDPTLTASDTELGVGTVPALNPSESASGPTRINIGSGVSPGTVYIGDCVDPVPGETNTGNNCSTPIKVTIQAGGSGGASVQDRAQGEDSRIRAQSVSLRRASRS